jgi:peptide/nickel transport system substrate-binding protein
MESSPEGSFTDNFNPFDTASNQTGVGATSLIYETLLQFNVAEPLNAPYDWLATGYSWGSGGKSITFRIRTGVKWNNGSALTPADVAFTYNMLKAHPDVNANGLPILGAKVSGNSVTVSFSAPQYTNLQLVASVFIVPQSVWGSVSDPGTFADASPVASGPYMLGNFASTGFTLKTNPHYWGGAPKVTEVGFPALASNDAALSALDTNSLDWAGNFIVGLQKAFETSSAHKVWFKGVNTVTLYPNLGVFPTNQLAVRKAISLAVDRTQLSAQGESGFEPPATDASGIVLPNFKALLTSSDRLNQTATPTKAESVLKAAGFVKRSNGFFYTKGGKELKITIIEPASYSDYAADASLVAEQLKAAGIDCTFDGTSVSTWSNDMATGSYQLAIHWGYSGVSAYGIYNYWLNSSLATGANKNNASGDFERLASQAMDKDLATLSGATTVAAQKRTLRPIISFMEKELPVIPILYGAAFDEYNAGAFTGWPTATNSYESGSPNTPTNIVVVLHLRPAG